MLLAESFDAEQPLEPGEGCASTFPGQAEK